MHHVPAATVEYSSVTLKEIIPNRSSMFFVLIKFSKFCYGRRVKIRSRGVVQITGKS